MLSPQFILSLADELTVDLFSGGGGASEGTEQATGRHVDIAVNHDPDAVGMHEINHPQTTHYLENVWQVDPIVACYGRPVGHLHASPDCTDHSQAKGGQPRAVEIRSLAWVVHRWAGKVKPRVITLENVEQMLQWSPLVAKRDPATGRVVTLDQVGISGKKVYRVADPGEQVPRRNQYLVPDRKRLGHNWQHFVDGLRAMGYAVQWRVICNADLGAHSTRERLYLIARRDGLPIVWPKQTHAKKPTGGLKPWRAAAECIDWSIKGRSIFGREKPLAEATMRRIAYGMQKFVLDSADPYIVPEQLRDGGGNVIPPRATAGPFIVPATHTDSSDRTRGMQEPMPTVTAANRGELMLLAPTLVPVTHTRDTAFDPRHPMRTITTAKGGEIALSAALLVQAGHGEGNGPTKRRSHGANDIGGPIGTITASGGGQSLAVATLVQMGYGERDGQAPRALDLGAPLGTVTAGGRKHALSTAFMVQANGGFNETHAREIRQPMSTVTTKGSQQQLITAHLTTLRKHSVGRDAREPLTAVSAGGEHQALVEYHLSQEHQEGALRCAAFLIRYHGMGGQWSDLRDPMTTLTTHDRLALVTVWLKGEPWVVVDIFLRMLVPRELYNAQDFPARYIIDRTAAGKLPTKTAQVRMAGNSVSPLPMRLIVAANFSDAGLMQEAA